MNLAPLETSGACIFLSPHYDDVVLSCGGTVAQVAQWGREPLMLTIFAGETFDELLTDFAVWKHRRWGLENTELVRSRRQSEDLRAAAILGCQTRWLGFPDAIYRGERYMADEQLFGAVRSEEARIATLIAHEVRLLPQWSDDATVYVPLGVGGHVDHQLTFMAGQLLAAEGARVWAYEDCPYAMHTPAGVAKRLADLGDAVGAPVPIDISETLERRVAAVAAYESQVPVIFRFTNDVPGTLREHATRSAGGAGAAERFWPLVGAHAPLSV